MPTFIVRLFVKIQSPWSSYPLYLCPPHDSSVGLRSASGVCDAPAEICSVIVTRRIGANGLSLHATVGPSEALCRSAISEERESKRGESGDRDRWLRASEGLGAERTDFLRLGCMYELDSTLWRC